MRYSLFLCLLSGILFSGCTLDFEANPREITTPEPEPIDPTVFNPELPVQDNLNNDVPILEILENVPVEDLYCLKYQGGLIYYINKSDGSGLVVTPEDISTNAYFGCENVEIEGADNLDIGSGAQNTKDIMASCNDTEIAAKICDDLVFNGYDDWFLPSINEYSAMRDNVHLKGCGNFDNFYVSSTEYTNYSMYYISMIGGNRGSNYKEKKGYNLRASRAF